MNINDTHIDDTQLLNYIKKRYPKIIVKPVQISDKLSKSLGFILSNNDKIINGYVTADGRLCRLKEPVDLSKIDEKTYKQIVENIPTVSTIDKDNKNILFDTITRKEAVSDEEHKQAMSDLKAAIQQGVNYNVLLTSIDKEIGNGFVTTRKEDEKTIATLRQEIQELQKFKDCRDTLLNSENKIKSKIQQYKEDVSNHIKNVIQNSRDKSAALNEIYKNVKEQTDKLASFLNKLLKYQMSLNTNTNTNMIEDTSKIKELEKANKEIQDELEKVKKEFDNEKLKKQQINNCATQIETDKESIILKMKEYKNAWINWIKQNTYNNEDIDKQKEALLKQLTEIFNKLNTIMRDSENNKQLLAKCEEIKANAENLTQAQLEELAKLKSELEEKEQQLQDKDQQLNEKDQQLNEKNQQLNAQNENIITQANKIKDLTEELARLIAAQSESPEINETKPEGCKDAFNSLQELYNTYIDLIQRVENSIKEKSPNEDMKKQFDNITEWFNKLNLQSITQDNCAEINETLNNNKDEFNNNIINLINLNEDINGAVRVYIRIKPTNEATATIQLKNNEELTVTCNGTSNTYGKFYKVFPPTFSTKDVFRGQHIDNDNINELELTSDIDNRSVYNAFKQVESGYSIVLFGYGLSGSGKTYTLLGDQGKPGLIHYGLANLENVQNIAIQNIFELYVGDVVTPAQGVENVQGKIINLVSTLPDNLINLKPPQYRIEEETEFNSNIELEDIKITDINKLTDDIEQYRTKKGRIKKTPNNPKSSRSHLFIIFKITFKDKTGYITLIDAGGRENPQNIMARFTVNRIAQDKKPTDLISIFASKSPERIVKDIGDKKYNPDVKVEDAQKIYDIYREGYYITESLNHLAYFLSKDKTSFNVTRKSEFWVNPKKEENNQIDSKNNCLMIPVLKYLKDGLNKDNSKPTKFITIVNTRQDNAFCTDTNDTLKFAEQIKSS